MVTEFSSEQARFYIARRRVFLGLKPGEGLTLHDEDQLEIMHHQVEADEVLVKACGPDVLIISDSSPLNSMLYMSRDFRGTPAVKALAQKSLSYTRTSFYAQPIYRPYRQDPNRIHDELQSREIDKLIPELLQEFPGLNVASIDGTVSERLLIVQDRIFFPR